MANGPDGQKGSRGVLYIVWGDELNSKLDRSLQSLQEHHPELPHHIVRMPAGSNLTCKAAMMDLTPFDTTLFLDADTVVLGRLDFAFEKAERHGLACCICESPWARRHAALRELGDIVEYNTGVLFFARSAKPVFDAWKAAVQTMDTRLLFIDDQSGKATAQPNHDQGGFALAIEQAGFCPFVLPLNYNYRPFWMRSFFGPIRIWHDYSEVQPDLREFVRQQSQTDSIISQVTVNC